MCPGVALAGRQATAHPTSRFPRCRAGLTVDRNAGLYDRFLELSSTVTRVPLARLRATVPRARFLGESWQDSPTTKEEWPPVRGVSHFRTARAYPLGEGPAIEAWRLTCRMPPGPHPPNRLVEKGAPSGAKPCSRSASYLSKQSTQTICSVTVTWAGKGWPAMNRRLNRHRVGRTTPASELGRSGKPGSRRHPNPLRERRRTRSG